MGKSMIGYSSLIAMSLFALLTNFVSLHVVLEGDSVKLSVQADMTSFVTQQQQEERIGREPQASSDDQQTSDKKQHKAFIMVGAVRTLEQTHESIVENVFHNICPPSSCVAHLITHFSYDDNRPDRKANNPTGETVTSIIGRHGGTKRFFQPSTYLQIHRVVPAYDIGSAREKDSMDWVENNENSAVTRERMRLFRTGDPRRYSMWFSRYWAWSFVKQQMILKQGMKFDAFMFLRPDMLWYLPLPTPDFFETFATKSNATEGRLDVWFHDSYFAHVPDTFALIPTQQAAERYFSMKHLVQPGVACLGGPNFDKDIVLGRLGNITTEEGDWCGSLMLGLSERILYRKLTHDRRVRPRYLPAGSVLVRTKNPRINCDGLRVFVAMPSPYTHAPSDVPFAGCLASERLLDSNDWRLAHPVRFVRPDPNNHALQQCWTRTQKNQTSAQPCTVPLSPSQIFLRESSSNTISAVERGRSVRSLRKRESLQMPAESQWILELAPLHTPELMKPVVFDKPKLKEILNSLTQDAATAA